jgi:hypothetical protein
MNQENRNAGKIRRESGIQETTKGRRKYFAFLASWFPDGLPLSASCFLALLIDKDLDQGQFDFDDCSTICTTKLFFSAVAGIVDPGCSVVVGFAEPGGPPPMID